MLSHGGSEVSLLVSVLVLVLVWLVGIVTVVDSQSSSSSSSSSEDVELADVELLVGVAVSHPVAVSMAQVVAQPRPLQFSWQGKCRYDVAGGFGQPQCCVAVLMTKHAGTGQVWHCSAVTVMVGQPVGGAVMDVVWWSPVAATGAMLCEPSQ